MIISKQSCLYLQNRFRDNQTIKTLMEVMERIINRKQEQWKKVEVMVKPFHLDDGEISLMTSPHQLRDEKQ